MKIRLDEMTWPEVEEILKETNVVILPVGSTEQHGPHLPLNFDTFSSTYIANESAKKVMDEHKIRVLVAPTIPYGEISNFKKFPGTIGFGVETTIRVVEEIVRGLAGQRFKNIFVLNGHSENTEPITIALRKVHLDFPNLGLFAANHWRLGFDVWSQIRKGGKAGSGHACEKETAMGLFLEPENCRLDLMVKGLRVAALPEKFLVVPSPGAPRVFYHSRATGKRVCGIMGDPGAATKENGQRFLSAVIDDVAEILVVIARSEGNVMEKTPEGYDL